MANEFELKFELTPDVVTALEKSQWLAQLQDSGEAKESVSVYFDTPNQRLWSEGMSLRVWYTGNTRVQTLVASAAIHRSEEW
jgi:inorganic triphosphatase YgiF